MGTNYYATKTAKAPCECCGRPWEEERLHIGKASYGWHFSLHVIPEMGINDLDDWKRLLSSRVWAIVNEDGETVALGELVDGITKRTHPFGLSRHTMKSESDLTGCVKHGEGTWDCITGDFS